METPYVIPCDPLVAELAEQLDINKRELFEERAGIRQFDGQSSRREAEALAMLEVLSRHPEVLSGICVLQIELDGSNEYLLTTDLAYAQRYVADVGGHEIALCRLPDVLLQQYGGVAVLATLG